jgi:hypothetical protein
MQAPTGEVGDLTVRLHDGNLQLHCHLRASTPDSVVRIKLHQLWRQARVLAYRGRPLLVEAARREGRA